ncbi:Radical SAM domain protein [Thermotoga petrophila RKU-1]|uniref:Radical SAM domain protein n=1 Tax=Thermotoga petrophila (strain ATCC BAA-488 / DSM 13995 / JCM 10881 / RKU-1) TaxID=390874 RepID=A5IN73_THEP1|nr:radical SAM protein [Thermotoga petrophila]ABQ47646.1 Radical SAM domain protein [Thermotoga petrophila RKU-1]
MKIIPVFLPYAGCKRRCVFCDQIKATGQTKVPSLDDIARIIEEYSRTSNEYELGFYGGTFTGLSEEQMEEYLRFVKGFPVVKSIRVSTRPDEINERKLKILKKYGVNVIEVGVQSFLDEVLEKSKRGYTSKEAERACKLIKKNGFVLSVHLMVGLPGSDRRGEILSALRTVECGADMVRIHPTLVFEGTELHRMMKEKGYTPLDVEEAVDICSDLVCILEGWGTKVIRIGYHVPVELRKYVVAGPFDPSLGDRVRKKTMKKVIEKLKPSRIVVPENYIAWFKGTEVEVEDEFRFGDLSYTEALFFIGKEVVEKWLNG